MAMRCGDGKIDWDKILPKVYIKGMHYLPETCNKCPFIQIGNTGMMWRCKLGAHIPYSMNIKRERSEDCILEAEDEEEKGI